MTAPLITPDVTDKSIAKELCDIPMEGSKSNWKETYIMMQECQGRGLQVAVQRGC